jgi:hypothetical protein
MGRFTGTVRKSDLAGGLWMLHADDGEQYQLRGGDARLRVEGQRVTIDGRVDRGAMGIGMAGAYLDVKAWSAATS